ncbi:thermonuclease family protein [Sphingobium sp. B2D3C]|uniref:thermonuclease family protein n=1 Tax=Sphingobium sp. B2D3C TaxID=2940581 RepID=UPI002224911E|nr:thermonuclease family protein [Sphingobium sp. B2D3C]MCW2399672.1 endonuclease YncB(thermonuclease family) [Sphingobium sp. B2D3C]
MGLRPLTIFAVAILLGTGAGAGFSYFEDRSAPTSTLIATEGDGATRYEICGVIRHNCVADGDTLWIDGEKIRIADIDTPEIGSPRCDEERALGQRAKHRLRELVNEGRFEVRRIGDRDVDKYNRKLRVLVRDGRSLGEQLVREGLARTWNGRREPWC